MKPKLAPAKEPQFLFLLSLLVFLELSVSGVVTLLISPDPKNALIFGFSALRLLLVAGIWIVAIIILGAGVKARKRKLSLPGWSTRIDIFDNPFMPSLWP
jgi:hypothetical protein